MSNELQTLQNLPCETSGVSSVSGSGSFLPRLQFFSGRNQQVTQGLIGVNRFGLIRAGEDKPEDLGGTVDVLVLAARTKAMDLSTDPMTVVYDAKEVNGKPTGRFAEIMAMSKSEDEDVRTKAMWGPEFLFWLPDSNVYATMLFGTASARIQAGNVRNRLRQACTLYPVTIDTRKNGKGFVWTVQSGKVCARQFEIPAIEEITAQVEPFLSQKDSIGAVKATAAAEADER